MLSRFRLKLFLHAVSLALAFHATLAPAQDRVAQGEYHVVGVTTSGAPVTKALTRWVVYESSSGRFRLESEIENSPMGIRVVQTEDLTDRFLPTGIGYNLYRNDLQSPSITVACDFSSGSVVCSGNSGKDQAGPSKPYKPSGPFWMWIEGLGSLDMPWLLAGALNMAHLENGKIKIATLTVSGGTGVMIGDAVNVAKLEALKKPLTVIAPGKPLPWNLTTTEESLFEFVASESKEVDGTKVAVRHYASKGKKNTWDLWITDSGLLTKAALGGNFSFVLAQYKQYRKIIPELQVFNGKPES